MDPELLAAAISPRTKAVIPVHLGGVPCLMGPIQELCRAHGLHLIEDCAQAVGATLHGRSVGSFGTGCFSLHPLKALSACGDAGFITTDDSDLAALLRRLRSLGHRDRDHVDVPSENARLDTLQAAILLVKLPHLDDWIARRRDHAMAYGNALRPFFELTRTHRGLGACLQRIRHPSRQTRRFDRASRVSRLRRQSSLSNCDPPAACVRGNERYTTATYRNARGAHHQPPGDARVGAFGPGCAHRHLDSMEPQPCVARKPTRRFTR